MSNVHFNTATQIANQVAHLCSDTPFNTIIAVARKELGGTTIDTPDARDHFLFHLDVLKRVVSKSNKSSSLLNEITTLFLAIAPEFSGSFNLNMSHPCLSPYLIHASSEETLKKLFE